MLVQYLSEKFNMADNDTKNLIKGIISTLILDLVLMLPMILYIFLLNIFLNHTPVIEPNLTVFIILITITIILIFIAQWKQYYYVFNTTYDSSTNKRISLAESIRKLPLSFFEKKDLSDLSTTIMGDCTDLEHVFSHAIPQIIGSILSLILISIGLIILNPTLAVSLLWVAPVSFILLFLSKKIQDKSGLKVIKISRQSSDEIQECLDSIKDIQSYNYSQNYLNKLENTNKKLQYKRISGELITGSLVTISQMILKLGIITVMIVGTNQYLTHQISLFSLLIFLIAGAMIYNPIEIALMFLAEIFNANLKINRMKTLENQVQIGGKTEYHTESYNLKFTNVEFSYNKNETILKNINFEAKQNQITALIGPSGSGKSTISKLAASFQKPDKGKITIGNIDINTINNEKILENYSIVFQDVILFNNTILENIRIGKQDATDEEIYKVAKIAKCDEFIEKLPQGYNTIIGENGILLSGGERQRISIARALLKDAPIIILDEATSFLDVENETKIQEAINHLIKNKTVIIIAHRMRTIMNADKIIVLDNGEIIETGTPKQLYDKKGLFYKMVNLQNKTNTWKI